MSFVSILPISNTLNCGLVTNDSSIIEPCCANSPQTYTGGYSGDIMYCEPKADNLKDFINCIPSRPSAPRFNAFCERNPVGEIKVSEAGGNGDDDTSFAVKGARAPSLTGLLLVALLTILFLVVPASASSTKNANSLAIRQSSDSGPKSCEINLYDNWTQRRHTTVSLANGTDCGGEGFCVISSQVDTGLQNNNRTLNGTNAANSEYDVFFEALGNSTSPKRLFPAMSAAKFYYEGAFIVDGSGTAAWSAVDYCVNGTVSNCAGVTGDSDGSEYFEACGPTWRDGTGLGEGDVIQGIVNVLVFA